MYEVYTCNSYVACCRPCVDLLVHVRVRLANEYVFIYMYDTLTLRKGLASKVHTFDNRGYTIRIPLLRRYMTGPARTDHRDRDIAW